jgi:hypothetical protein
MSGAASRSGAARGAINAPGVASAPRSTWWRSCGRNASSMAFADAASIANSIRRSPATRAISARQSASSAS